jgi:hypothetical protein
MDFRHNEFGIILALYAQSKRRKTGLCNFVMSYADNDPLGAPQSLFSKVAVSLSLLGSIQVDMSGKFLGIMQHLMHFVAKSPSLGVASECIWVHQPATDRQGQIKQDMDH